MLQGNKRHLKKFKQVIKRRRHTGRVFVNMNYAFWPLGQVGDNYTSPMLESIKSIGR